jgi:putative FmdB family regulatory protein
MPVYEFACNACGAPVSIFVRSISSPVDGACERCGSRDLRRLVSRFAVKRPSRAFDEATLEGLDENDPRAMASWARQMQREMGADAGPELEEMVQRLESGESLDDDGSGGLGGMGDFGDDDDF